LPWKRAPVSVDIDECAIGLEPCRAGQQCVNMPGSFRCERRQRPTTADHVNDDQGVDDDQDDGRQRDTAVGQGEGELDGNGGRLPRVTASPTERTSSSSVARRRTTRATTTAGRRHRPSGLHCGTGFHYNRHTGRCEGTQLNSSFINKNNNA